MTITIGVLFIFAMIGLVAYLLTKDPERKEVAKILFWTALLALFFKLDSREPLNIRTFFGSDEVFVNVKLDNRAR